jgi:hypothetical protein
MAIYDKFPANSVALKTISSGSLTWDLATRESHTVELDPKIHALDPAVAGAPILGMMNKIGAPKTVNQPIYFMLRKRQLPRFFDLTADWGASGTTLTAAAADISKQKAGYHILNTLTREIVRVTTAGATSTTSTIVRGVGTVAAAACVGSTDECLLLYYRGAEKDVKFLDFIRQPDVIFNYVAELQKCYGISQYERDSGHTSGMDPLAVLRADKLQEQRLDAEFSIIFDQRAKFINEDNRVTYISGGVDSFLTENEKDYGGSITEAKVLSAARTIKRHGPVDRWVMASPLFMEKFNQVFNAAATPRQLQPVPTEIGLDITTYRTGGLRLHFFEHPLLDDATSTSSNTLKGHAFVLDLDDMDLVTMRGELMGFFKWFMRVQTPGNRERQDQLVTNLGVKMRRPEHYARWFNVGT